MLRTQFAKPILKYNPDNNNDVDFLEKHEIV